MSTEFKDFTQTAPQLTLEPELEEPTQVAVVADAETKIPSRC